MNSLKNNRIYELAQHAEHIIEGYSLAIPIVYLLSLILWPATQGLKVRAHNVSRLSRLEQMSSPLPASSQDSHVL